jgi:hypothetical protein
MYYNLKGNKELGFDAFIAPDDFNRFIQPVDIYEVFKREYALDSKARYIYYYSDGNFPLTLTPTTDEYYRYGYTQGGVDVIVDVPIGGSAVTIFSETVSTKRWVCVYRVSSAKFNALTPIRALWGYFGISVGQAASTPGGFIRYMHFADINSIKSQIYDLSVRLGSASVEGTQNIPETVNLIWGGAFMACPLIKKVNLPKNKDANIYIVIQANQIWEHSKIVEFNIGASTGINDEAGRNSFVLLSVLSVSESNTLYSSFNGCDIIFTKDKSQIVWLAPKTVRGICLPDELPQAQVDALGTKLSTNLMANYQLYIGTQITNITNLYLSNKRFVTVDCSADNPNYTVEAGILYNTPKTQLLKAGTNNAGNLAIPNTVQSISAGAFNGCDKYTGKLTIGSGLSAVGATIAPNSIAQLTKVTELEFVAPFDTAIWSIWNFATFTGESIYNAIQMLVDGTAGNVKYFYINQATMDNLLAYNSGAVEAAGLRFINVATVPANPALYLPLKTNILDLSANAFVGTAFNSPTFNDGIVFNGTNQYLDFGNILNIGTGSFCLSVQILSTQTTSAFGIVGKTAFGSINGRYGIYVVAPNVIAQIQPLSNNSDTASNTLNGNWHTLTLNFNKNITKELYIDGVLISSVSGVNSVNLQTAGRFFIGCYGNSNGSAPQVDLYFNGKLKNVFVYQRALSNDELIALSQLT